jgi:hypothetical protein
LNRFDGLEAALTRVLLRCVTAAAGSPDEGCDATGVIFGVFVVECELMRTAKLSRWDIISPVFPDFPSRKLNSTTSLGLGFWIYCFPKIPFRKKKFHEEFLFLKSVGRDNLEYPGDCSFDRAWDGTTVEHGWWLPSFIEKLIRLGS